MAGFPNDRPLARCTLTTASHCSHHDHVPEPLAVGAREFKTRLGTCLRQVRAGRVLTITDRGRPVAVVTPIDTTGQSIETRLDRLRAEGVVTGAGKALPSLVNPIAGRGRPFSETIVEDREDRF